MPAIDLNNLLNQIEVGEIWGVGRKLAPKLQALGLNTVLDLKRASPERLRQQFSVVMEKTIRELNGEYSSPINPVIPIQNSHS